jgi:glutamate--cysteine ligase
MFVLFCLLQESPALSADEINEIDMNLVQVAHTGRKPAIKLSCRDETVELKQWASNLLDAMQGIALLLDVAHDSETYRQSLAEQLESVADPDRTTSARMLNEMRNNGEGFFHFARRMSVKHYDHFKSLTLSEERKQLFSRAANESIEQQRRIEAENAIGFDEFLRRYFAQ